MSHTVTAELVAAVLKVVAEIVVAEGSLVSDGDPIVVIATN